jgi:hypothetical protein
MNSLSREVLPFFLTPLCTICLATWSCARFSRVAYTVSLRISAISVPRIGRLVSRLCTYVPQKAGAAFACCELVL